MNIPLPQLCSGSETEQLQSMKTYLYNLAQQLQFALGSVEKTAQSAEQTAVSAGETASAVSANQTPQATFASVKALIIKSADIVDAYYEQINRRLSGEYVASSDFGTFREQTEQDITENADGITRAFESIQTIDTSLTDYGTRFETLESSATTISDAMSNVIERVDTAEETIAQTAGDLSQTQTALSDAQGLLSEVQKAVAEVNAWIKTGKLGADADDTPIYGVEIGQQTTKDGVVVFQKFSRLTSDRLSFYDQNGTEVSCIGDETMFITKAEISALTAALATLTQLRMGEYLWVAREDGHYTLS